MGPAHLKIGRPLVKLPPELREHLNDTTDIIKNEFKNKIIGLYNNK